MRTFHPSRLPRSRNESLHREGDREIGALKTKLAFETDQIYNFTAGDGRRSEHDSVIAALRGL